MTDQQLQRRVEELEAEQRRLLAERRHLERRLAEAERLRSQGIHRANSIV